MKRRIIFYISRSRGLQFVHLHGFHTNETVETNRWYAISLSEVVCSYIYQGMIFFRKVQWILES